MADKLNGDCYLCGANLSKTAMRNHLLKNHGTEKDGEECCFLKIEGGYNINYWLYIDIPLGKTLSPIDGFLRKIWLECCGHLSEFYINNHETIRSSLKLESLTPGKKFFHLYDYGTTTETAITVMGTIRRPAQKGIVRLLARNAPPVFKCADCGKTADYVCGECFYQSDNPYYCDECMKSHECGEEMFLPVSNSPRMGECGYTGEFDTFGFNPLAVKSLK